ncbi:helix-turn-helix domain-containing protein [Bradyrhizobium sp. BWC-3-1]|uniref:helix-turn-helix domain-containing protein n=1 Tax=Bradyrhizobium sp. BWC-3-1 TaxID=3080012 RepID=UPI00293F2603|nr:helix-turn-helix domain-containing protein [Bradyrhizobium sp. BWC-3-1]WOH60934.1 helix-turn-helix domain-containing protein [Bradyrhizobium sp. BWC-3-1]
MTTPNRTNRSRRDKRQKFVWLDQVKADKKLPRSAFIVAFQLMQGFNANYGGATWKSIETLAKETGLSEPSIVRITRQLAQRGHLKIEHGKAGRGGHSNRYFMVKKTSADEGLETSTDGGLQTSPQTSAGDPQTSAGGGDLLKNHLTGEAQEASPVRGRESGSLALTGPASAPAPVGGALEAKETVDRLPGIFSELLAIWQRPHGDEDETAAWEAFAATCSEGDPEQIAVAIIASGHRWVAAYQNEPNMLKPLWKWIRLNTWKHQPRKKQPQRNGNKVSLSALALEIGGR